MSIIEILENKTEALDANDLALLLKLTPRQVYELVREGKIPSMKIDGAIRFDPGDLVQWLKGIRPKQKAVQSESKNPEPKKEGDESLFDPDADGFAL
jgi:Helix-turn-helix domain